nr:retrovirus-related Pol polyprotein from transposon TNT 1-94 [Tanacetum cinerariifolium]
MLFYLTRMEPYYIQCIKDGPFQPKIAEGANKPKAQWSNNERRVVNQDQRLKSIFIPCLPNDIMDSIISYAIAKDTWIDLVHNFEGPLNTKENKIMDMKLEYNTFRAKPLKVYLIPILDLRPYFISFQMMDEKEVSNDEEMTQVKVLIALADDELAVGKNHARNDEWIGITRMKLAEASSKNDVKESLFIHASMDYDHEKILKSKDWVERYNPDSKLPNFNTKRILVLEIRLSMKRPGLGALKDTKPETQESSREDHRTSDHMVYVASLKNSKKYRAHPYQYASPSKQILKAKAKPFPPCTHYGFNGHRPNDHRMYPKYEIYGSKSLVSMSYNTCGSTVHSTTDHSNFEHFKRGEKLQATKAREPIKRTMSSSNHPTSNIEDAFSSNFLDFIPASSDYVPTSPGKTYSSSSNSFGVVPITSPSLFLFHNDPYMKVLQAFYAKESPIPPPNPFTPLVILAPSPVLPPSLLFNP